MTEYVATRWYRAPEIMRQSRLSLLCVPNTDKVSQSPSRNTPKLLMFGLLAASLRKCYLANLFSPVVTVRFLPCQGNNTLADVHIRPSPTHLNPRCPRHAFPRRFLQYLLPPITRIPPRSPLQKEEAFRSNVP